MSEPPLSLNAWLRWELIRRELLSAPPSSILELGMGMGAVGSRLSRLATYDGVEPDPRSRAVAEARLAPTASVHANLSEVDDGARFDVVCAFEVLEHIERDDAALAQWTRHLQPDGRLLLSVPAHQHRYSTLDELAGHLRRYSRGNLDQLLRDQGLEPVRIDAVGFPLALALEHARNLAARRHLARQSAQSMEERTAGSARLFQPPAWTGWATRLATAPFRWLQLPFRHLSWTSGWFVVARRTPG